MDEEIGTEQSGGLPEVTELIRWGTGAEPRSGSLHSPGFCPCVYCSHVTLEREKWPSFPAFPQRAVWQARPFQQGSLSGSVIYRKWQLPGLSAQ